MDPTPPGPNLPDRPNPLLADARPTIGDPTAIRQAHTVLVRERYRDIRDLRRQEAAAEAVAGLSLDGRETFGLTRGQFSLIDMVAATLDIVGPADLTISTWTAAHTDIGTTLDLVASGRISAARWLVDLTFMRRCPQLVARIRDTFGRDAIRVTRNHAKFLVITNATWQIVLRTSMNLNHNPRLEDFTIAHDPELARFLLAAVDDIWRRQHRSVADQSVRTISQWWNQHG